MKLFHLDLKIDHTYIQLNLVLSSIICSKIVRKIKNFIVRCNLIQMIAFLNKNYFKIFKYLKKYITVINLFKNKKQKLNLLNNLHIQIIMKFFNI